MYPVPPHAASIWLSGNEIHLTFPPLDGNDQSNTIKLPWTDKGIAVLLALLRRRETQSRPQTIATPATPTQWHIDQWLKAVKKAEKLKAASVADIVELDI